MTKRAGRIPIRKRAVNTLVVARDDDFTHGVLKSRAFALWWTKVHSRRTPTVVVESFPFPWPPRTELNALTSAQEEQRHAVTLAARGDDPAKLEAAISAVYGTVHNHFNQARHLISRNRYRERRSAALAEWRQVMD